MLEYSCSFCIESTCEQETCGRQWGWLNQLEECRQTIVVTETYNTNLDRLQSQYEAMTSGRSPVEVMESQMVTSQQQQQQQQFQEAKKRLRFTPSEKRLQQLQSQSSTTLQQQQPTNQNSIRVPDQNSTSDNKENEEETGDFTDDIFPTSEIDETNPSPNSNAQLLNYNDNKFPRNNLNYRLYCSNPTAELNRATLRCYSQCPPNYKRYGISCFSNCMLPQKDEFSTYCIEPEVRKRIELFSSCAEDCNENNMHDFCFACPEGMHKQDCQCVKSEKIEFREILERSYTNAMMLLIDE